jgi:hypothetical protein
LEVFSHTNYLELKKDQREMGFASMILLFLGSLIEPEMKEPRDWFIKWLVERWKPDSDPLSSMKAFQIICETLSRMNDKELQEVLDRIIGPHIIDWKPVSLGSWRNQAGPKELKHLITVIIGGKYEAAVFRNQQKEVLE